jgi:hypothetical protein
VTRSIIPPDTLVSRDAAEFGAHVRSGGWRLGLLVARNVYRGRPSAKINSISVELGKVSTAQFARKAGISDETIRRYLTAWELAATQDLVPATADLRPGQDPVLRVEDLPEWSSFTVQEKEPTDAQVLADEPKPESKGRKVAAGKKPKKAEPLDPYVEFKIHGRWCIQIRSLDGSPLPEDREGVLSLLDTLREQLP